MIKKKIKMLVILSLLASLVLIISISSIGCTTSNDASKSLEDYPKVVQKLAQEFDLDPDKVLDVLEQTRENIKENMKKRFEKNQAKSRAAMRLRFEKMLGKAVEEGEITLGQMKEILAKKTEIAQIIEELKDLPPGDRKQSVLELRDSIKDWAEKNDLDLKFIMGPQQSRPGKFLFQRHKGNSGMSF